MMKTKYDPLLNSLRVDDLGNGGPINLQGNWNAATNTPDISGTTLTGYAYIVTVAGTTELGGISDWQVNDLAVKTASGWGKIDSSDQVPSAFSTLTEKTTFASDDTSLVNDSEVAGSPLKYFKLSSLYTYLYNAMKAAFDLLYAPIAVNEGLSNLFINGTFAVWQRGTSSSTISTTRTYLADRFAITTGAGTLTTAAQSSSVPSGSKSKYSLELTGRAGVTTVTIDQRIEAMNTPKATVYFSAYIYNGSGAAFTPKLLVSTPSASNNWATSTVINGSGSGESLQECADSAWTKVYWSADISAYSNIANGVEFKVEIPSGSLVSGDTVRIADVVLTYGSSYIEPIIKTVGQTELECKRYYWIETYNYPFLINGLYANGVNAYCDHTMTHPVPMRIAPTMSIIGSWSVSNCIQPTVGYSSTTTFTIRTQALAEGRVGLYAATSGNGISANAEL